MGKKTTKSKTSNKKRIYVTIGQAANMPEDAIETLTDWWKTRIINFQKKYGHEFKDKSSIPDPPNKVYYYLNDKPVTRKDIDKLKSNRLNK